MCATTEHMHPPFIDAHTPGRTECKLRHHSKSCEDLPSATSRTSHLSGLCPPHQSSLAPAQNLHPKPYNPHLPGTSVYHFHSFRSLPPRILLGAPLSCTLHMDTLPTLSPWSSRAHKTTTEQSSNPSHQTEPACTIEKKQTERANDNDNDNNNDIDNDNDNDTLV